MAILNTVAQFGRYMLRSRISTAGACEVWLAQIDGAAAGTGPVVFKKMRTELAQDASLAETFTQHARRATLLTHECIGRVLDVVVDHSDRGYAMEFIDGKTLRQLISAVGGAGNALPIWFAIHVTRRICQALEHAHAGVVTEPGVPECITHGNLRPENVFLTFLGKVKVTDFGLSASALMNSREASIRAPACGPWHEPRTKTQGTIEHDLYGVGSILFELLTGICPEPMGAPSAPFVPPSSYSPWVNVEVDQLLSRILSPEDSKRFHSASEIRQALDEYLSARRHEVTSSHVAGLVAVLFSAECLDSAPPTMRLQEGAAELSMLRSRRTTPPTFASLERQGGNSVARNSATAPPHSQASRQTVPAPVASNPAERSTQPSLSQTPANTPPTSPAGRMRSQPARSSPNGEVPAEAAENVSDARTGPFHHDWDLALKRAREEAQATQRSSGNAQLETSTGRAEPPIDPLEQAVTEFERGLEHMRRGEFAGALQAWERTLALDPQHRICRANLNLLKKKLATPS